MHRARQAKLGGMFALQVQHFPDWYWGRSQTGSESLSQQQRRLA